MFSPVKVTPIEVKDGKVIECTPIIIDIGDYSGCVEVKINGKTYLEISFSYDNMPSETICIKESWEEMRPFLTGG